MLGHMTRSLPRRFGGCSTPVRKPILLIGDPIGWMVRKPPCASWRGHSATINSLLPHLPHLSELRNSLPCSPRTLSGFIKILTTPFLRTATTPSVRHLAYG